MAKKKKAKNKKTSEKYKKYKLESGKVTKSKTCPKCGPGIFLGVHKERVYCGKCHYMEVLKK